MFFWMEKDHLQFYSAVANQISEYNSLELSNAVFLCNYPQENQDEHDCSPYQELLQITRSKLVPQNQLAGGTLVETGF